MKKKKQFWTILRIKCSVNVQWNIRAVQNLAIPVMVAHPDERWSPQSLELGNESPEREVRGGPPARAAASCQPLRSA